MILQSLKKLAEDERLVEEPAFQSVPVRWIIDLDAAGKFLTLDDTAYTPSAEGKRKPRQEYQRRLVPRRSGRTSGDKAEFLVDKSDYVLGVLPEGENGGARTSLRRALFVDELKSAYAEVPHPVLASVLAFLEDHGQRELCSAEVLGRKLVSNDLFTFRVRGVFLDELAEVKDYWIRRTKALPPGTELRQCLVCGKQQPIAEKHDNLKLAGAVTSGVALISFNAGAFKKHGLSGNENAPVCRECMVAYVNALRRCLDDKYPHPDGGTFPRQSVRLSPNTTAVYWDEKSSELAGVLYWLNEDPTAVKALLQAAWNGERPAFPTSRFYCLVLTGVQGRASVRGMHTSTVEQVAGNVQSYFECLEAAGYAEKPAPIYALISALAVQGKLESLPPELAAEVFLRAVLGKPLSRWFLTATVSRIRAERDVTRPRAALLNLYFQRYQEDNKRKVPMSLDPDSIDPAYRYGRLLAVLEALQINYHNGKKPNSTIVDRFYAAASTRPATVFPRLLTLAQNHLKTAPSAVWFSKQIAEVLEGLDGANGFRPMLNIEEQGRFALGYFHQRAVRFNKSAPTGDTQATPEEAKHE